MEERLIYFDNAATAWPKPESVYKFMDEFFRTHGVNPGRSGYDLAIEAGSLLDRTRKRLTKFFGGDEDAPSRLVFGYNVTDALNLAIPGLISRGDHRRYEPRAQLGHPARQPHGSRLWSRSHVRAVQLPRLCRA